MTTNKFNSFFVVVVFLFCSFTVAIDVWLDVLGMSHDSVERHKDIYSYSPLYSPVRWNMRVPPSFRLCVGAPHRVSPGQSSHNLAPSKS